MAKPPARIFAPGYIVADRGRRVKVTGAGGNRPENPFILNIVEG